MLSGTPRHAPLGLTLTLPRGRRRGPRPRARHGLPEQRRQRHAGGRSLGLPVGQFGRRHAGGDHDGAAVSHGRTGVGVRGRRDKLGVRRGAQRPLPDRSVQHCVGWLSLRKAHRAESAGSFEAGSRSAARSTGPGFLSAGAPVGWMAASFPAWAGHGLPAACRTTLTFRTAVLRAGCRQEIPVTNVSSTTTHPEPRFTAVQRQGKDRADGASTLTYERTQRRCTRTRPKRCA